MLRIVNVVQITSLYFVQVYKSVPIVIKTLDKSSRMVYNDYRKHERC
nr:MAG TPA: hypothetical protein [Caudoviricetes sp.]